MFRYVIPKDIRNTCKSSIKYTCELCAILMRLSESFQIRSYTITKSQIWYLNLNMLLTSINTENIQILALTDSGNKLNKYHVEI